MRNTADRNNRALTCARHILLAGIATGFLLARSLHAHDTWILPSRPGVTAGQQVTFDLTSGMAFPTNEVGVKPDRLARACARLGEAVTDLGREVGGKKALRLKARFPQPGIAAVWIESKPRALQLKPAEVKEYLEEIGAWDSVGRRWESGGQGRWRELYTKHAKTYVRVGRPDRDDSWARPVGMELELVPESDPTHIAAGEELPIRLLKNGQPAPDVAVGLVAGNAKSGTLARTDSEGRVRLRFDRSGWWLVRTTVLEPSSRPDLDWESRFATLTIFVAPK
jgi:uncharacterized GH25 family protein